jgi:hypothetical protein
MLAFCRLKEGKNNIFNNWMLMDAMTRRGGTATAKLTKKFICVEMVSFCFS